MNRVVEEVNNFRVKCPSCEHPYQHVIIDERSQLLHATVKLDDPNPQLPTTTCRLSYDYVYFRPCQHCCPESFARCPLCTTGEVGHPTNTACS